MLLSNHENQIKFSQQFDGVSAPQREYQYQTLAITARTALDQGIVVPILKRLYKQPLNEHQRDAVRHGLTPLLALAGAGTGKTHVIVSRIVEMILAGMPPRKILAVTFTNKAADEMEERLDYLLGKEIFARPEVSTLHSLGSRILKAHADVIGYSKTFEVVSDIDQDPYLEYAIDKLPSGITSMITSKRGLMDFLRDEISNCKNSLKDPESAPEMLQDAYFAYQSQLQKDAKVDCDDLLYLANQVLTISPEASLILKIWQKKFDFITVDEYQDTNHSQEELVRLLAADHKNLTVVGDDDQSIYGWRGADVEIIRSFPSKWSGADVVSLLVTYRAPQPILDLSNQLMTHDSERHKKVLIAQNKDGEIPRVLCHTSQYAEAEWIGEDIVNSTLSTNSTAILLRWAKQMIPFIEKFEEMGIPYEVWKSDRMHIGDEKQTILALLKCIDDPAAADTALMKVLRCPSFALSESSYEQLQSNWSGKCSLWEELSTAEKDLDASGRKAVGTVQNFLKQMAKRHEDRKNGDCLKKIAQDAIVEIFPTITQSSLTNYPKGAGLIVEWIARQMLDIEKYESDFPDATFRKYLGFRKYRQKQFSKPPSKNGADYSAQDPVIISTIHAVKGLEFKSVYVPALEEGILPGQRAIESRDPKQIAEERRLFYVAMTRAKQRLTLSWSQSRQKRGRASGTTHSQFLEECGALKLLKTSGTAKQRRLV